MSTNRVFQFSCTIDEIKSDDKKETIRITIDYDSKLYSALTIQSFCSDFLNQIKEILNLNDKNQDENIKTINQFNDLTIKRKNNLNKFEIPKNLEIIDIIEWQCRLTPENTAILKLNFNKFIRLSYSKLIKKIKQNAAFIRQKYFICTGYILISDTIIPLIFQNNNVIVEWILSVLESGAAYSIINANDPCAKISLLCKQLDAKFGISDVSTSISNCVIINIDKNLLSISLKDVFYKKKYSSSITKINKLAYVCFTSGTTGTPKGVCIDHSNLIAFIFDATKQLKINSKSRIGHSVNCTFDVSFFNIFATLFNGACLIQLNSILNFVEPIIFPQDNYKRKLTHLFINSAIFNTLNNFELEILTNHTTEHLLIGGETPSQRAIDKCINKTKITQIYGPTECTIWSLYQRINLNNNNATVIGIIFFI